MVAASAFRWQNEHEGDGAAAYPRPHRVALYNVQPGWLLHSTLLSVEHSAAVPVQAFHEQPVSFEQAIAPVFDSQAAATPAHELPVQLQPAD